MTSFAEMENMPPAPPVQEKQETKISDLSDSLDEGDTPSPEPFAGMGKADVIFHSDTPFFNNLRKAVLVLFLVGWICLLGGVIYLTVTHRSCEAAPEAVWWKEALVYQIYPRSYMDSDGDAIGDLKGIQDRLDHLVDIGVGAVWISPFYSSPMADFGYDVSDFTDVDTIFGSMQDFDSLISAMHAKDIRLIMDFIPNHSSDEHEWFIKSKANDPEYKDWYMWEDCPLNATNNGSPILPTNWVSVFGGPMWAQNGTSERCYLHQFFEKQPDLNYRNNRVKDEMDNVLRFWLDKGVDGFRVDAIAHTYEDYELKDESLKSGEVPEGGYNSWNHSQTANLPEVMDMVNRWRGLMNEYTDKGMGYRFMMTEAYADPHTVNMYYGRTPNGGADFPFNFNLLGLNGRSCDTHCIEDKIQSVYDNLPDGKWANWVLGNHDRPRIASTAGDSLVDGLNMLLLLLQGTPTTYYGEELGMSNLDSTLLPNPPRDNSPDKRDKVRSPMQWSDGLNAGFTTNTSLADVWLPTNSDSDTVNVKTQYEDATSHLNIYKELSKLRKEDSFKYGHISTHLVLQDIYSFRRFYDGRSTYLVAIHFGLFGGTYDLLEGVPSGATTTVVMVTPGTDYKEGEDIDLGSVKLSRGQGIVVSWPYQVDQRV